MGVIEKGVEDEVRDGRFWGEDRTFGGDEGLGKRKGRRLVEKRPDCRKERKVGLRRERNAQR